MERIEPVRRSLKQNLMKLVSCNKYYNMLYAYCVYSHSAIHNYINELLFARKNILFSRLRIFCIIWSNKIDV